MVNKIRLKFQRTLILVPFLSFIGAGLKTEAPQFVYGESLVLAKGNPSYLCFDRLVKGRVQVRSKYKADDKKNIIYKEDIDYIVNYTSGTIRRTKKSRIPDFSLNPFYGKKDFGQERLPAASNHEFFVWVDYYTTNGKPWAEPNDQIKLLRKSRKKLETGGPFRIVTYGDSITAGGEASEPDLRFTERYAKYLQSKFPRTRIEIEDRSIPGHSTIQAIAWWDKYIGKSMPDLVLLGWGMNDHNIKGVEPEQFKKNLIQLVGMIRMRKGAEVVLFSSFPPHNDWHYGTHRMNLYAAATKQAAVKAKCAYVDVYTTWDMALRRKDQSSLLGNNINHPNDFGHWMYLQAFKAMKF
ncbi:MAG: GDSL-type esterase/lipase family protein [Elusimicrobia bacterium]|nr:GDSL-type esterase/lipase family protein [Elusimicrobiota bacterium]